MKYSEIRFIYKGSVGSGEGSLLSVITLANDVGSTRGRRVARSFVSFPDTCRRPTTVTDPDPDDET